MIHFNFSVDDIDAMNIFSCINDAKCNCNMQILKLLKQEHGVRNDNNFHEIKWYESHILYLEDLILKMKSEKIEEKNEYN